MMEVVLKPCFTLGLSVIMTISIVLSIYSQPVFSAEGINEQFKPKQIGGLAIVKDPDLKVEMVLEGLHYPTSMTFLGPNDILVSEKNNGTVQRIINWRIQKNPVLDVPVATRHSRGILGIAVEKNNGTEVNNEYPKHVLVYFTSSNKQTDTNGTVGERSGGNVLYRYELISSKLLNPFLLLKLSPKEHPDHNGGAIIIGPDHHIYVSVGDGGIDSTVTQNVIGGGPPNGGGGILILSQQGTLTQNTLGYNGWYDKYYAYGIRNSFGLAFDPVSGKLWDTENGPSFGDEINLVKPGFNSGWIKIQGIWKTKLISREEPQKGQIAIKGSLDLFDFAGKGKYSGPEFTWDKTIGPTALVFVTTDKLGKKYKNDLLVADVKYGNIYHFSLNNKRSAFILDRPFKDKVADSDDDINKLIFGSGFGGITDMEFGPDGYLYVLSFGEGKIYKISPK